MNWKDEAYKLSMEGLNGKQIATRLGKDYQVVRSAIQYMRRKNGTQRDKGGNTVGNGVPQSLPPSIPSTYSFTDTREIKDGEAITPESIMKKKGLKVKEWEVISFTSNTWEQQGANNVVVTLCQSKLSVKPKKHREISFEDIDEFLKNKAFTNKIEVPKLHYNTKGEVLEIDVADLHCGLLSWRNETGSDYDLHICAERFLQSIQDIADRVSTRKFKDVYLCGLGDLIHVDNDLNTTTKGTPQQVDGRIAKIFDFAFDIMNEAIDLLRPLGAKLHYIYLCGNHDRNVGYYLAKCLQMSNPDVEFDIAPNPQKIIRFGKCLVGLMHGDMPKKNQSTWLLTDYRRAFGESEFVEIHSGHIHTESARGENGIMVRSVLAECGNSYWEHLSGYRSLRGLMAFIWNEESGLRETLYYYDI